MSVLFILECHFILALDTGSILEEIQGGTGHIGYEISFRKVNMVLQKGASIKFTYEQNVIILSIDLLHYSTHAYTYSTLASIKE